MKRKPPMRRRVRDYVAGAMSRCSASRRRFADRFPRLLPLGESQTRRLVAGLVDRFRSRASRPALAHRHPLGLGARRLNTEPLEERRLLSVGMSYVDDPGTYAIDSLTQYAGDWYVQTDQGVIGMLDAGDTVTWQKDELGEVADCVWDTHAFGSIQNAIDATDPGGTVNVAAGTYLESLVANKSINLLGGNPADAPVIDGSASFGYAVTINGSGIDVAIEGVEMTGWSFGGINLQAGDVTLNTSLIAGGSIGINVGSGSLIVTNSTITGTNMAAVYVAAGGNGTATVHGSDLSGNLNKAVVNQNASATVDASSNYWGTDAEATVLARTQGKVDFTPFLTQATDTSDDVGFQGDFSNLAVTTRGQQTGTTGRIQEGIDLAAGGEQSVVFLHNGLYKESNTTIDKPLLLQGESRGGVVIAPAAVDGHENDAFANAQNGLIVGAGDVTIRNLTIDGEANTALSPNTRNFRQGIISNGNYDAVHVDNVSIAHVYRRGIAISGTTTIDHVIENSSVDDVWLLDGIIVFGRADILENQVSSIHGMGNSGSGIRVYGDSTFTGSHTVADNTITDAQFGVTADVSAVIRDNVIDQVNVGIVMNNLYYGANSGSLALIQGNQISNINDSGAIMAGVGMSLVNLADGSLVGGPNAADRNTIDIGSGSGVIGMNVWWNPGGVTIQNNELTVGAGNTGIEVQYTVDESKPVVILDNVFTGDAGAGTGVLMTPGEDNGNCYAVIKGNQFVDLAVGVDMDLPSGNKRIEATIGGSEEGDSNVFVNNLTAIRVHEFDGQIGGYNVVANIVGNLGSIHGNAVGIDVVGGSAVITGNAIYDNATGILVRGGGSATIEANNFDGDDDNATDLRIDADADTVTLGDGNQFAGDDYFIDNRSSQSFDLTALTETSYESLVPGTNDFAIEDKMFHGPDDVASGVITWVAGNLFVTAPGTGASDETIQNAIDVATADDQINLDAGEYAEGPQIVVDKNLTIVGQGMASTTVRTTGNTGSSGDARGWWLVQPGVDLDLSGMKLDGSGYNVHQGIRHLGTGTIDHVAFENISYPGYMGTAVAAMSYGGDINVLGSTFSNIGRIGVIYFGAGTTGLFEGNTYTGKGAVDRLDYAVEVGGGAVVEIRDNTITGNRGVASSDGSTSAAILVTSYYGDGTTANITENNILTDNSYGVAIGYNAADTSVVTIDGATIAGNDAGVSIIGGTTSIANVNFDGSTDNMVDLELSEDAGPVTLGDGNQFAGDAYFIDNRSSQSFDLTSLAETTYEDLTPGTDDFAIEDKMFHGPDSAASGVITWVAGNLFVTAPGTGASNETIQNAIDVAASGDTINVQAGEYVENVVINKSVILAGESESSVELTGRITLNENADGVVVRDMTLLANNPYIILVAQAGVENLTIQNVTLDGKRVSTHAIHSSEEAPLEGAVTLTNLTVENMAVPTDSLSVHVRLADGAEATLTGGTFKDLPGHVQFRGVGANPTATAIIENTHWTGGGSQGESALELYALESVSISGGSMTQFVAAPMDKPVLGVNAFDIGSVAISGLKIDLGDGSGGALTGGIGINLFGTITEATLTGVIISNAGQAALMIPPAGLVQNHVTDIPSVTVDAASSLIGNGTAPIPFAGLPHGDVVVLNNAVVTLKINPVDMVDMVIVEDDPTGNGQVILSAVTQHADIDYSIVDDDFDYQSGQWFFFDSAIDEQDGWYQFDANAFSTIQAAIDAADAGETIYVQEGTYVEQVIIEKNITVIGQGIGTIVASPDALAATFNSGSKGDRRPIVTVRDGATATIQDLTVDGLGKGSANAEIMGIAFHNAGGTIDNVWVTRVRDGGLAGPLTGVQHGVSITAFNDDGTPRTVDITNSQVDDFQKTAIALFGPSLTVDISGNTITGVGPTGITAQNGIQLSSGAAGTISGNMISGVSYTGASWAASSILLFGATGTTVSDNEILVVGSTGGDFGIAAQDGTDNLTITGNRIDGTGYAVILLDGSDAQITANELTHSVWAGVFLYGPVGNATIANNTITDGLDSGIFVWDSDASGTFATHTIRENEISGNAWANLGIIDKDFGAAPTSGVLNASANYWGTSDPDAVADLLYGADAIDFTPILLTGDANPLAGGYQGYFGELMVHAIGGQAGSIARVQEGINLVDAGGTVHVNAGTYNERLLITKSLNLLGEQAGVDARGRTGDETIITEAGLSDPNANVLIEVASGASGVVIDGFTLVGDPTDTRADTSVIRAGGTAGSVDDLTIANNVIDGRYGIIYKAGSGLVVSQNDITANKSGVAGQFTPVQNIHVANNDIKIGDTPDLDASGVYFTGITGTNTFTGNRITGFTSRGLGGSAWTGATISGNTFEGNRDGVSIWGDSSLVDITGNQFIGQTRFGASVKVADMQITGNTFDGNATALDVEQNVNPTTGVTISGNTYLNMSGKTGILVVNSTVAIAETITDAATAVSITNGAVVSIADSTLTGNGVGVSVDAATAVIRDTDLTGNTTAGIAVANGATVDAGTETSAGNNVLTGYLPFGTAYAIENLNLASQPDVQAEGNNFGSTVAVIVESVLWDDTDDASLSQVIFTSEAPTVLDVFVDDDWQSLGLGAIVDPDGDGPLTSATIGVDAFGWIQQGVDAVAVGGTVHVNNGLYIASNTTIDKPLTLVGESRSGVVIAPAAVDVGSGLDTFDGDEQIGFMVVADGVTIQRVTLDGQANNVAHGGMLPDQSNFRVGIMNYDESGQASDDLTIDDVTIRNVRNRGVAFYPGTTSGHIVSNSLIEYVEGRQAIYSAAYDVTITGNTIRYAGLGIGLYPTLPANSGATLTVTNNTLTDIAGSYSQYYGHSYPAIGIYYRNSNYDQKIIITGNDLTIGNGDEEEGLPGVTGMYIYNADANSLIADNTIDSTGGTDNWGIYLGGCAGTTVQNNVFAMNDSDSGIYLGRGVAGVPVPNIITGNTFISTDSTSADLSEGAAILQANHGNLFWMVEDPLDTNNIITNNIIAGFVNGIVLEEDPVSACEAHATIGGNTITGAATAVLINGALATIGDANTIRDCDTAVFIDGVNAFATITGNAIYDNATGILVRGGASATIEANNFDGDEADNATDLRIDADAGTVTLGDGNQFAGDNYFIDNRSSQSFDLTGLAETTYEGLEPGTDDFAIEDKMFHGPDDATSGVITWLAGNLFVTAPSTGASDETIQNAIDVASAGNVVNVQAGVYAENLVVNKSVTLAGESESSVELTGRITLNEDADGVVV
ncbi:MAG: hypothetical protein GX621_11825, partial [Pirellulaceae bacterium]|nr:hypothetical protein [Pirellulaceae bacterium]